MSDVIVAISTARGEGAVGIVRLSGSGADKVASQLFYRKNFDFSTAEANKLYLGTVTAGRISDKAMAVIFKAPKSYTGEDVIEFHLHGGRVITEAVLEAAVNLGARPAEPGEFTKRAYLNGKISLSAAEGVEAIISADSAAEAVAAYRALGGELDRTIKRAEELLISAAAMTDVALDYPEEMVDDTKPQVRETLIQVKGILKSLIGTERDRKLVTDGISVVLAGLVNAGKSSLMNALCGAERAIVTEYAGTTRDVLKERLEINGIKVTLSDTAGIREGAEGAEKIGIERAENAYKGADLVLFVMDGAEPESEEERGLYRKISSKPNIRVMNKCDATAYPRQADVEVSALTGENMRKLSQMIAEKAGIENAKTPPLIRERGLHAAKTALKAVEEAVAALDKATPDCLAVDIKEALATLCSITGEDAGESVVTEIFSRFCVGK